jgi:hypothetical protein
MTWSPVAARMPTRRTTSSPLRAARRPGPLIDYLDGVSYLKDEMEDLLRSIETAESFEEAAHGHRQRPADKRLDELADKERYDELVKPIEVDRVQVRQQEEVRRWPEARASGPAVAPSGSRRRRGPCGASLRPLPRPSLPRRPASRATGSPPAGQDRRQAGRVVEKASPPLRSSQRRGGAASARHSTHERSTL